MSKPLPVMVYYYKVVFRNGDNLNIWTDRMINIDALPKWMNASLQDANRDIWTADKVSIRVKDIMFLVLERINHPGVKEAEQ